MPPLCQPGEPPRRSSAVSLSSSVGCGGGGPEIVHVFELKQARNVIVNVVPDPNSPAYQPVVYLRNACDLAQVANEFACVDAGAPKASAGFAAFAPPGLYFVVVDGFGATGGAFTLTVQLAPAPFPQGNDKCAGAVPLMVANNRAIAAGDLRGNNDDLVGSCGSKGADVVYSVSRASRKAASTSARPIRAQAVIRDGETGACNRGCCRSSRSVEIWTGEAHA